MSFHVNPKTGNSGKCSAKKVGCPFGVFTEHFTTREEAQKFYEEEQESFEHFEWKTTTPPTKGATTLAVYDHLDEAIKADELWGNKLSQVFVEKMDAAAPGTRLVIENGQVFVKSEFEGSDTYWKFVGGYPDITFEGSRDTEYNRIYLDFAIKTNGARLETGGATPSMPIDLRRGINPSSLEIHDTANELRAEAKKSKEFYSSPEELTASVADYVTERWSELPAKYWDEVTSQMLEALKAPVNKGSARTPRWTWQ